MSLATASLVDAIPDAIPADRRPKPYEPALVAFTGGTAFNGIIDELLELTSRVTHVIPVSDDGGSTAEIVRVLGGPAVGDLRSRCLRLSDESTDEARAVKALLAHRLHATDSAAARLSGTASRRVTTSCGQTSPSPTRTSSEAFCCTSTRR